MTLLMFIFRVALLGIRREVEQCSYSRVERMFGISIQLPSMVAHFRQGSRPRCSMVQATRCGWTMLCLQGPLGPSTVGMLGRGSHQIQPHLQAPRLTSRPL